jgi:hypothetical protein
MVMTPQPYLPQSRDETTKCNSILVMRNEGREATRGSYIACRLGKPAVFMYASARSHQATSPLRWHATRTNDAATHGT